MKRVHLLNHRQLLQGFRPRFSAPVLPVTSFVLIVIALVVVVVLIVIIIVVEVPLSTPVLGEANRIVSVIIVIISTGRCPAAGAAATSPSTGVLGPMVLRWGLLVNVALAGGRGCRIAGNVPCAVGPPPFPLVLVADN